MSVLTLALRALALSSYSSLIGRRSHIFIVFLFFLYKRNFLSIENGGTSKTLVGLFAASYVLYIIVLPWSHRPCSAPSDSSVGARRPLLFPCHTTHTRLFPKKHSFTYSYLLVGVPVGWKGNANGMLSAESCDSRAWYRVDAADYLQRGARHLGLRGKLDAYLTSQGADPSDYPSAYLVTAARFLGYHFNPVSFWYLYSDIDKLAAVVLEVNNTFDERRMYFLKSNIEGNGDAEGSKRLRQFWPKDFHVSPFNSRKGDYSLVADDPFLGGATMVNNTITLSSSKGSPKLIARIASDQSAIDPFNISQLRFLWQWWWVGFATFPRIVREAGRLFFSRGLHVWYRPEPLPGGTMGRRADGTEKGLERAFRAYLRHLVDSATDPLAVRYVPCGIDDAQAELMRSPSLQRDRSKQDIQSDASHKHSSHVPAEPKADIIENNPEETDDDSKEQNMTMELHILTPSFYSRFVGYSHDLEALFCELRESNTIHLTNPQLLPKLVVRKSPAPPLSTAQTGLLDYVAFSVIRALRQRPERITRPMTSSSSATGNKDGDSSKSNTVQTDIRGFRLSGMDGYFLGYERSSEEKVNYRDNVLRLFMVERLALGFPGLLWMEMSILRILLFWVLCWCIL